MALFGNKRSPSQNQTAQPQPAMPSPSDLAIDTAMTDDLWQKGTVQPGNYTYSAKVLAGPSADGIDGGPIIKLHVSDAGGEIVSYDRGWDVKPAPGTVDELVTNRVVAFYRDHAHELPRTDAEPVQTLPQAERTDSPFRLFKKRGEIEADHEHSRDDDEGRGL